MAFGTLGAVLTAALDEMDNLFAFDLVDHIGLHGRTCDHWRTNIGANHQNFIELNFFAGISSKFFNPENIPALNPILFATGLEDRKHMLFLRISFAFCGPGTPAFWQMPPANSAPP